MFKILIRQIIFSIFLAILVFLLQKYLIAQYIHSNIWGILIFFTLLNLLCGFVANFALNQEAKTRALLNLLAVSMHFFFSIIFIVIALFFILGYDLNFALNFFILYILFLGFEVYILLDTLRAILNTPKS